MTDARLVSDETITREQVLEAIARVSNEVDRENITAAFFALEKYAFETVLECPVCGMDLRSDDTEPGESNGGG